MSQETSIEEAAPSDQRVDFAVQHQLGVSIALAVMTFQESESLACNGPLLTAIENFRQQLARKHFTGLEVGTSLVIRPGGVMIPFLPTNVMQGSLLDHWAQLIALAEQTELHRDKLAENCKNDKPVVPIEDLVKDRNDRNLLHGLADLARIGLHAAVQTAEGSLELITPSDAWLATPAPGKSNKSHHVNVAITGVQITSQSFQRIQLDGSQWVQVPGTEHEARIWMATPHSLAAVLIHRTDWLVDTSKPYTPYPGPPDRARDAQLQLDLVAFSIDVKDITEEGEVAP